MSSLRGEVGTRPGPGRELKEFGEGGAVSTNSYSTIFLLSAKQVHASLYTRRETGSGPSPRGQSGAGRLREEECSAGPQARAGSKLPGRSFFGVSEKFPANPKRKLRGERPRAGNARCFFHLKIAPLGMLGAVNLAKE